MVWFHGGHFVEGSAAVPLYDGSRLAGAIDAVVIGVNHRVGLLGYAAHSDLRDDETGLAANWAVLDQLAALAWIRDHVEGFGGDPGNVTIFGQSAGAMSVCALLACPPASGLFHRAILQSGGPSAMSADRAAGVLERLVARAGLPNVAALQSLAPELVVRAQRQLTLAERRFRLGPVVDGRVVPHHPLDAAGQGATHPVPLIVGTTCDEVRYVYAGTSILSAFTASMLRRRLGAALGPERADAVIATYTAASPSSTPADLWVAIETDRLLRGPAFMFAGRARRGSDVFGYVFAHRSPDPERGACHGLELPLLFGTDAEPVGRWLRWDDTSHRTALVLRSAWLAFAAGGRPSGRDGPWPVLNPRSATIMRLCADGEPTALDPGGVLGVWEDDDFRR